MKTGNVRLSENVNGHKMDNGITHVLVDRQYLDECVALINQNSSYGATVGHYHGYDTLANVDFLARCPQITHLNLEDPFNDISALAHLTELHTLRLHPELSWHDYSVFPQLTVLTAGYNQRFNGLSGCRALTSLKLRQVNSHAGDLSELTTLASLKSLALVKGNIVSLAGLEKFHALQRVELSYMKNLKHIEALLSLTQLNTLALYSNANAIDIDIIKQVNGLRTLNIYEGGEIISLSFINELRKLTSLSFVSTDISDGELNYLLSHPTLKKVTFLDKPHYTHQFIDIQARLNKKL